MKKQKIINLQKRKIKTRVKIKEVKYPRLSINASNIHIFAQIIDKDGKILASASDLSKKFKLKGTKIEIAKEVGKIIAQKAKEKKIKRVVFDRGGKKYHGRIKSLAEEARKVIEF